MNLRRFALALLALTSVSCTTAGPFVTSISSDGQGGLIVEKSMVKYNSFMGTVSNENTTTTTVRLFSRSAYEAAGSPAPQPKEIAVESGR